ncbi:hypothetical protein BROUX41_006575 [Berkeleyomyces rouxiae]|uniref:uncharacterized protein n=1 Tax=Berkeleyomyces rouxiae TaxID=2035830 RepID=UPI003B7728C3
MFTRLALKAPASAALHSRQVRWISRSSARLANYGFIGLGQMGFQMARNLQSKLSASDNLAVFDVNASATQTFCEGVDTQSPVGGATTRVAASVFDAAKDADVVITVLPEPAHVSAVFDQILTPALPARNRTFIDCSTIDPTTSQHISARVATHSSSATPDNASVFVDAPMSGGVIGATAGTLTFMLGGTPAGASAAAPALRLMGAHLEHCGPAGAGLAAKLANNYVLAVANIATAEAMNLGVRWGLDARVLARVLAASTGRCWPVQVNNPVPGVVDGAPAGRDYRGGFGLRLMAKDVRLAATAARDRGVRMELVASVRRVYEEAEKDERCAGRDFSVVYRWLDGEERK